MINANELRIGNWVNFTGNGNDNFIKVNELWKRELVSDYMGNELCLFYTEDDLQPIPLTPEILEKCGFVRKQDWFYKAFFVLGFLTTDSHFQTELKFAGTEGDWRVLDITSLHQLQNLYFCLVGEELLIKL
jgi:hypothetical protein